MSMFTVHLRAGDLDRPMPSDEPVFVREGFSWGAYFFAPLWSVFRRSWLGFFGWIAAAALILALGRYFGVAELAIIGAFLALNLIFGFEAAQLRRRSLARRGYHLVDVVSGHNSSEAEISFALRRAAQFNAAAVPASPQPTAAPARPRPVSASDSFGLAPLGGGP